jgi:hypothetical protein
MLCCFLMFSIAEIRAASCEDVSKSAVEAEDQYVGIAEQEVVCMGTSKICRCGSWRKALQRAGRLEALSLFHSSVFFNEETDGAASILDDEAAPRHTSGHQDEVKTRAVQSRRRTTLICLDTSAVIDEATR